MIDIHAHLQAALAELKHAALMSTEIQIILLVGPSGVGKTTLLKSVMADLVGERSSWPEGEVRAVLVVANKDDHNHFSLGVYYTDLLGELGNPFFQPSYRDATGRRLPIRVDTSIKHVKPATREALLATRCRYVFLDEGNRIASSRNERVRHNNLDLLRASVEKTPETRLIVAGTYDMLVAVNRTAQIDRRTHVVHLPRYGNSPKDAAEFARIVDRMTKRFPLPPGESLVQYSEMIYRVSLGSYGEAEKYLLEADLRRILSGDRYLSYKHLMAALPTQTQLETLAREVAFGEERLMTKALDKETRDRLAAEYAGRVPKKRRKQKAGMRNRGRDPVGTQAHEIVATETSD